MQAISLNDTCITYANKKMKSLETVLNQDLKIMSDWPKANRLCLNVDKSKYSNLDKKSLTITTYQLNSMDANWSPLIM